MAQYRMEQINFANWISYLTGLDSRIVDNGDETVTIDGKFILDFPIYSSNTDRRYMRITVNGTTHQTADWYSAYTTPFIQTFISENVIIIRVSPSNMANLNGGHEMVFVNDGNGNYYAGVYMANPFDINSTPLYNVSEGTVPYKLGKLIQFVMANNKVGYSFKVPIVDNSGVNFIGFAEDLLSCSTVPSKSSITFEGDNYFALSTNILIKIDT